MEHVRRALVTSPTRSGVKHASALGISQWTFRRLVKDLSFHPYKIKLTQVLKPTDYDKRLVFAHSMMDRLESRELTHNSSLMSNEAHFHLCESVNKQNCRYYSNANQHQIHAKSFHSERVTVWYDVTEWGIISPHFFTGNVNTMSYTSIINMFLPSELKKQSRLRNTVFQQDGATCHTSTVSTELLKHSFDSTKLCFCLATVFARLVTLWLFPLEIVEITGVHFQAAYSYSIKRKYSMWNRRYVASNAPKFIWEFWEAARKLC